ncbi:tetratricopeptide repeat domain protein [Arcticibacter svalbardensis MN12-7]|uniref:Tetratricopeptide repeat domain protein n=1 Tax=Arcticibacter svalbardensis MN12-7 TaxID=1150600 RepID=R9H1Z1_9SPHI|nr:tetratricopeptide repeat domain protein [Arcticibacter svalbardensis MN12-7]
MAFPAFAQSEVEDRQAMEYYQAGAFEQALPVYQKLYANGAQPEYYDQYLSVLLKTKNYQLAEELIKKMIAANKSSSMYQIDYGRLLQEQGFKEKADELYNGLLRTIPKDEFDIRELAGSFYRANALDYSIKAFLYGRKALNDPQAFGFDLISLYRYQKNKQMLVLEYINILSKTPDPQIIRQAQNNFNTVFDTPEDYTLLKNSLVAAMSKNPPHVAFGELLSWTYLQQNDYASALKQLISLDKKGKMNGEQIFNLGETLLFNKAFKEALMAFEYLDNKSNDSSYHLPSKARILYCKTELLSNSMGNKFGDAELPLIGDNLSNGNLQYAKPVKAKSPLIGNNSSNSNLQGTKLRKGDFSSGEVNKLEAEYGTFFNEARNNPQELLFAMRNLANFQAYQLRDYDKARSLLEKALSLPNLPAALKGQIKLELGDIYILGANVWDATLLYSQVEKEFSNKPLGQDAKYRNAKLSYYRGDFVWAKVQLDVLKSATTQLIANDALNLSILIAENTMSKGDTNALAKYAEADFFLFCNHPEQSIRILDSINRLYPQNSLADDILMLKARIFLKQEDNLAAISCLDSIVSQYSYDVWADDALFMLGTLYESKLKEPEKAKHYYEKIIMDFPGSLYIAEARLRFRKLRGDSLG